MYNIFTDNSINTVELPKKSCMTNFSLYKQLYCPLPFRSFSIKYVGEGCEKYTVNGNKYNIHSGNYLLANHYSEGLIEIDSNKNVKGICIDISPEIISEVVASYRRPDTAIADNNLDMFFNSKNFFENQYNTAKTKVGGFLTKLDHEISKNPYQDHQFSNEFYYSLAEKVIEDHIPIYKQLQSIPKLKSVTKKDLLRKILHGKNFINENYLKPITISTVATECCISEYHFFRLFKNVFGISPMQFIIHKRLIFAKGLLEKEKSSMSTIATLSGFSNNATFSKSFSNYYGISPSDYLLIK